MTAPADDDRIDGDTIDFATPQRRKSKRRTGIYAVLGLFFLVGGGGRRGVVHHRSLVARGRGWRDAPDSRQIGAA